MQPSTILKLLILLGVATEACFKQPDSQATEYKHPQSSNDWDNQLKTAEHLHAAKDAELQAAQFNAVARKSEMEHETSLVIAETSSKERLARIESETYLKAIELNSSTEIKLLQIQVDASVKKAGWMKDINDKELSGDQDWRDLIRTAMCIGSALIAFCIAAYVALKMFTKYIDYSLKTYQLRQNTGGGQSEPAAAAATTEHRRLKKQSRCKKSKDEDNEDPTELKEVICGDNDRLLTRTENISSKSFGVRNRRNNKPMKNVDITETIHTLRSVETDLKYL